MRAVIDEDLHRSLKGVLEKLGFLVYDIRDYGLRGMPDSEIYKFALKKKAVLFTADLGFSNIISFPLGAHFGICILRFPNEISTEQVNVFVRSLLLGIREEEYSGNLVILSPGKARLRRHNN